MSHVFLPWILASLAGAAWLAIADRSPEPASLSVMSFNLRYASEQGEQPWSRRKGAMLQLLREADPDILGTQEGLFRQLEDLAAGLPDHAYVGLGRRGGSHDEYCAIFYRKSRFTLLEYDHFWLSEQPNVIGSLAYDADLPRMVTWARFADRETDRAFYVVNTHFDHAHETSRLKSATQLRAFLAGLETKDAVIVTGDFNAAAGASGIYTELVGSKCVDDALVLGGLVDDPQSTGTFHGFTGRAEDRGRIDWILFRGALVPTKPEIVRTAPDGVLPSDHFPVRVQFEMRE